ncbi:hypothetical protein K470DRAFT_263920 [Piedraia hortae CBS 480.64]|uniref:HSA domain-containing protein n=1 Tax=Piedraia hortae CBS 480.64 TaxID=1314780 RepID=A0A6A7C0I5_9PEZI|nr:hypothetical protein K470DRAFT_263920 [Piedraia hortae CBS 480.64]
MSAADRRDAVSPTCITTYETAARRRVNVLRAVTDVLIHNSGLEGIASNVAASASEKVSSGPFNQSTLPHPRISLFTPVPKPPSPDGAHELPDEPTPAVAAESFAHSSPPTASQAANAPLRRQSIRSRPSQIHTQTEIVSSPSSTIGTFSATTPGINQESPDTSPGSDTAQDNILIQPEHERILAAQKEEARRRAAGGEVTPDEQLQWEAREAEERTARLCKDASNGVVERKRSHQDAILEASSPPSKRLRVEVDVPTIVCQPPSPRSSSQRDLPTEKRRVLFKEWPKKYDSLKGAADDPYRDYFEPLFRASARESAKRHSLKDRVEGARKCVLTEDFATAWREQRDQRVLRRIHALQDKNKWSLRQMQPAKEPKPLVTHLDVMMREMREMRRDFRDERKLKKKICAHLARSCAEYMAADEEKKKSMQGRFRLPEADGPCVHVIIPDSLRDVFSSSEIEKAVHKLTATKDVVEKPETLVAVSKFAHRKLVPVYSSNDDDDEEEPMQAAEAEASVESELALFHPEYQHLRDRLHANTVFKPPTSSGMPSAAFYEFRSSSQWQWEDDQRLRQAAREFSFNWDLISNIMADRSRYANAAERRSAWESFERWVELEQLPGEMRKQPYFKTWFGRIEQGQQGADQRLQNLLSNGQAAQQPVKKTGPQRVEKRKDHRYTSLLDTMHKSAKNRENNAHKTAEALRAARQRRQHADQAAQTAQTPVTLRSPFELSKRRQEIDVSLLMTNRSKLDALRHNQMARQAHAPNAHRLQANGATRAPARTAGSHGMMAGTGVQGQMPRPQYSSQYQMANGPGSQQTLARGQQLKVPMQQPNGTGVPRMAAARPSNQMQRHGQLSSGHTPRILQIKETLRKQNPNMTEEQIEQAATSTLREQETAQAQQSLLARQNAMNAAAGLSQPSSIPGFPSTFAKNPRMAGGDAHVAAVYALQMRDRQHAQMMQPSPNLQRAVNGGSPKPNSPPVAYATTAATGTANMGTATIGTRPGTSQMRRVDGMSPTVGQRSPSVRTSSAR